MLLCRQTRATRRTTYAVNATFIVSSRYEEWTEKNRSGLRLLTRTCGACRGSNGPDWNHQNPTNVGLHLELKVEALPCDRFPGPAATKSNPFARLELWELELRH